MKEPEVIPHLFRTEYRKIVAVLCKVFGIEHIEIAEDIVSDTFLMAAETWGIKGLPKNPTAWLYTVSKNKAIDFLRRQKIFDNKVSVEIAKESNTRNEFEIDLSSVNIKDSQLQMMFAICNPCISVEAQIGLSLNILCGFGVEEIAEALLKKKESVYKQLLRGKEKLRLAKVKIELPGQLEINERLETVLTTLYLLFSEGYYSTTKNKTLQKELCLEAMRLNLMLVENKQTNIPSAYALLALMCLHSSRFDARLNLNNEIIVYEDQDTNLWNLELIKKGEHYLNLASEGNSLTKYHLEAAIAYWHTQKTEEVLKWENILQLYNKLLMLEYSPFAALNRTYALSKARGKKEAIVEAEKLNLIDNHFYFSLLGYLYTTIDNIKAVKHYQSALHLAKSIPDKKILQKKIFALLNT